jgi:acetyl-CoA acetyltransferase family protein
VTLEGREVVVVEAVRTPMGRHGGQLCGVRVDELAAHVLAGVVERCGVDAAEVDEVVVGCVNMSGEAMGNVARYAALLAGFPDTVAGVTVNRFCASGLSAIQIAAQEIATGMADVVVAAGAESMTRSTWSIPKPDKAFPRTQLAGRDTMWSGAGGPYHPRLVEQGAMIEMPEAAQKLAGLYSIARAEADAYALRSHARAAAAQDDGRFDDEILPLKVGEVVVDSDETIRRDTTLERLAALRPYYPDCLDITAGNTSQVNDGASALLLATRERARAWGVTPLARVLGSAVAGVDPALMGLGAARALARALERAGIKLEELDLVEINEAFAVQVLACLRDLPVPDERLNVNGGAISLGHALGNSGARITVTLLHELRRRGEAFGAASLCIGGGQGAAMIFEALS